MKASLSCPDRDKKVKPWGKRNGGALGLGRGVDTPAPKPVLDPDRGRPEFALKHSPSAPAHARDGVEDNAVQLRSARFQGSTSLLLVRWRAAPGVLRREAHWAGAAILNRRRRSGALH